ncbi:MAG: hypothetical protein SFU87_13495 [Chitinophagaceae bacterium]|nr:hypothetical protein [Chitinophagaceae bacterium]
MENRIQIALDFLKEGKPFTVCDLRLEIDSYNTLVVTGWSHFLNFANLTKNSCLSELREIKDAFSKMVNSSSNLKKFIEAKEVEYVLCYDDAGKASIDICSEKNEIIKWKVELNTGSC